MIPIIVNWCSNANYSSIRCRVYDLIHNKSECDEANKLLFNMTNSKPVIHKLMSQLKIRTMEELKLLGELSSYIESSYTRIAKRDFIDITKLSKN